MLPWIEALRSPSTQSSKLNPHSRTSDLSHALCFFLSLFSVLMISCTKEMAKQDKPGVMKLDSSAQDLRSDLPLPAHSQPAETFREPEGPAGAKSSLSQQLAQGQKNYEIYCSLCHDRGGSGLGMITLRGFPRSKSLTAKSLSQLEIATIIRDGQGAMPALHGRLSKSDQESVALFVRALFFSHHVPRAWLNQNDLHALDRTLAHGEQQ